MCWPSTSAVHRNNHFGQCFPRVCPQRTLRYVRLLNFHLVPTCFVGANRDLNVCGQPACRKEYGSMRLAISMVAPTCSPKCLLGSTLALRVFWPRRLFTFSWAIMSTGARSRG